MTSSGSNPAGDPIDVDVLVARCLNDAQFVREVLGIFREQAIAHLAQLNQRLEAGDAVGARQVAHGMKGSAANMAADRLRGLCSTLEQQTARGSLDGAADIAHAINAELERCVAFFPQVYARLA